MFKQLFMCYWRLTLFQERPENTPYSVLLMLLLGFLYSALIVFQWQWTEGVKPIHTLAVSIFTALSLAASYLLYTYVLLYKFSLSSRIVKTVTCLWATHLIVHLMATPLLIVAPYMLRSEMADTVLVIVGMVYLFLTLGLSIWQFMITAHIYRFALNISMAQSLLASIGLLAVNIFVVSIWR